MITMKPDSALRLIIWCVVCFALTVSQSRGELFSDGEQLLEKTMQRVPNLEPEDSLVFSEESTKLALSSASKFANWTKTFSPTNYRLSSKAELPNYLKALTCSSLGPAKSPQECLCYQARSAPRHGFCHYDYSTGVCAEVPGTSGFWSTYEPSQHFQMCKDHVWLKYQSHIKREFMPETTFVSSGLKLYEGMVRRIFEEGVSKVDSMKQLTATPHHMYATGSVHASVVGKSHDIIRVLQVMVREAEDEIILVDCYYEPGSVAALLLRKALLDLNAKRRQFVLKSAGEMGSIPIPEARIKVYILFKKRTFGVRTRRTVAPEKLGAYNLPTPEEAPFLDIKLTLFHKFPVGTLHSKLLVVDRQAGLLLSSNLEDVWFSEIALHVEGTIVDAMQDHFWGMWSDSHVVAPRRGSHSLGQNIIANHEDGDKRFQKAMRRVDFKPLFTDVGEIVFHELYKPEAPSYPVRMSLVGHPLERNYFKFDARNPQDSAFLAALALAKDNITISTPNMNSRRVIKAIVKAVERNVTVDITLTLTMNDLLENMPLQGGDNLQVARQLYAKTNATTNKKLRICWYSGKRYPLPVLGDRSHIKFLAADDQVTILGSGNQDTQSWYHSQEVNVMVDSPVLTKLWIRMMSSHGNSQKHCFPDHLLASPNWKSHFSSGYSHDKANSVDLLNHLEKLKNQL